MSRKTGESCRTVDLGLENGQKVSLLIRSSGDVVRVYLNDKDLPLKGDLSPEYQETFKEGIAEIAGRVRDNQNTFNAQQAKQKATVPQPKDAQGRRPPQNTTQRRKQLAEQEAQVDQDTPCQHLIDVINQGSNSVTLSQGRMIDDNQGRPWRLLAAVNVAAGETATVVCEQSEVRQISYSRSWWRILGRSCVLQFTISQIRRLSSTQTLGSVDVSVVVAP